MLGAGLGGTVGGLASGEKPGQALLGGAESGGLAFAGGEALGALSGGNLGFSDLSNAFGGSGTAPALFGGGSGPSGFVTPGTDTPLSGAESVGSASSFLPGGAGIGGADFASGTATPSAATGAAAPVTGTAGLAAPAPAPATPAVAPGVGGGGAGAGALAGPAAGTPSTPLATTLGGASPAATGTGSVDSNFFLPGTSSPLAGADAIGPFSAASELPAAGGGLSGIGSTVGNWLMANPGIALGGALLGYEGLTANQPPPGLGQVEAQAKELTGLGNQALSAQSTGNIPGGAQAALDEAQSAAQAQVRSQYAALGLSGSTMESQALAQIPQQIAAQKWQIIQGLTQTGLNEMGMADTLDLSRMSALIQQDQQFQSAISSFAAALAGGTAAHGFSSA